MLNYIWLGMLLAGVVVAGLTGNVRAAVDAAINAAQTAVTLAIGLVGVMALWLGIMRLAEVSGLVAVLARALRPVMQRLFPDVPPEHPAMASMMLNIAANMLGLTNAATPFGLRAMRDLETLNPRPGTATNAMCTFLAINTGSVQLIPASAIALLAASGSANPTAIVGSTLLATCCSSAAGLTVAKLLERLPGFRVGPGTAAERAAPARDESEATRSPAAAVPPAPRRLGVWARGLLWLAAMGFVALVFATAYPESVGRPPDPGAAGRQGWVRLLDAISLLAIPFLLAFFPLYAALRGIAVFEEFVEGAKEGFHVAVRIIPYLVGMLVAIGLLRGSGAVGWLTELMRPPLSWVGFPPELVPITLIRPLSGSASLAAFSDVVNTFGPDSLLARMAGTLFGSTETTFYVVAVYFGSIAVKRVRHAVWAGLAADATGAVAAVAVCRMMFG
jgi:spore maturation protein SpmA